MSEREQTGQLGITLEMVADNFSNRELNEYLSPAYLRDNMDHMKMHQPLLHGLIMERPIEDFKEKQYFVAGAATTYDLIHMADPDHWESTKLSHSVILNTLKNFQDSELEDKSGGLKQDRGRVVVDLEWFYLKLGDESPRYKEWLDWITDGMTINETVDFLFGSFITAMPFYLTRESEKLNATFGEIE